MRRILPPLVLLLASIAAAVAMIRPRGEATEGTRPPDKRPAVAVAPLD